MKRCPTCRREYTDDALSFCLDDGAKLESAAPPPQQDPQATLMITPEVLRTMQAGGQTTSPIPPPQQTYTPPPAVSPPPTQYSQAGAGWGATPPAPAPPKKKSALPWIIGGVVVLLLGGIGVVVLVVVLAMNANTNNNNNQSGNNNNNRASSPTPTPGSDIKAIASSDGASELSVPADWQSTTGLNAQAAIQAKNPAQTMFAVVITAPSSPEALETYASGRFNSLKGAVTGARESGPVSATINGEPAAVYELHGTISNGAPIGYLFAVVKTAGHFHQIYVWSEEAIFATNRDKMQSILESFREK